MSPGIACLFVCENFAAKLHAVLQRCEQRHGCVPLSSVPCVCQMLQRLSQVQRELGHTQHHVQAEHRLNGDGGEPTHVPHRPCWSLDHRHHGGTRLSPCLGLVRHVELDHVGVAPVAVQRTDWQRLAK